MDAVFPRLSAKDYAPHGLHALERCWPETNCYVDLWIEVLSTLGLCPEAVLGFTVEQDFEGDQFTFFKIPPEDLDAAFGLRLQELAIYDRVESHIATQIARGRLCLLEVDSYFLADTVGVSYRLEHGKTTIAVNRLDLANRRLGYFHNAGYFELGGDDFDGLFGAFARAPDPALPPYAEFVKLDLLIPRGDADLRIWARDILRRRLGRKPGENPVAAFQRAFAVQAEQLAQRPFAEFHKYAFNTLRQLGANFELLGAHLTWLEQAPTDETAIALGIAEAAKAAQFQLARACTRKRFDRLEHAAAPAVDAYDLLFEALERRYGVETSAMERAA